MNKIVFAAAAASAAVLAGCIHVKTESEIKPIHITMDVNLKVDRELDKAFSEEAKPKPQGDYKRVKELIERKVVGVDSRAMLVERDGATDDDRMFVADANAKRMKRFSEIAKENGTSLELVQRRHAAKMRERMSAGTWYQDDSGAWRQK